MKNFIKLPIHQPPSSRYNALSIGIRARYSLVLCDFGLTAYSLVMSITGMIKVSAGCPTFDGTDYPYWKNKMRMHLEAIDNDLWYVV